MSRTRSLRAGQIGPVDGDGRTVDVRLVAWNTPADVSDDGGRTWYQEQFARGGLTPGDERMLVRNEHSGAVIGRIRAVENRDDGAYAVVRVADTSDGRDLLGLLDEDVLDSVSVEFDDDPTPARAGSLITRTAARLTGLAFTLFPAHPTAAVLGRRSSPQEPTMPETTTPVEPVEPEPTPEPTPEPEPIDQHLRSAGVRRLQPAAPAAPAPAPVGRFRSFGEFVRAAATRQIPVEEQGRYFRALSTAGTTDAPGLFAQETWINEIIDLRRTRTPALSLFSQRPLPDKGLTINQPTIIQRPLVDVVPELTQIPSRKLKIGSTSWDVATYGGGQATSVQLIERSDPSYIEQLYRMYMVELSLNLEADVAAAVLAAADDTHSAQEVSVTNGAHVDAFIDAAALLMGAATIQSAPEVLGLSVDMWVLLAKAKDASYRPLFPSLNPMNAHGSMQLSGIDSGGSIMNLQYAVVPGWSGKVAVMGVRDAFRTMLGPVSTMDADVPENLSREHAVYQFAAFGAVDTAGLVKIIDT